ncbi:GNAT family N-acetyltransferase [Halorhabdus rudnickae]|uniref:GNAT family N-acetyltransferase n=1 Tax=Halorhabdus rudnickae TaxID=1775544 RepID=UPI0014382EDF|nr:GNAT family N-acetyltransferase [Halorhabdus rudnickae]
MGTVRPIKEDELDALRDLYGMLFEETPAQSPAVEAAWDTIQNEESTVVLGVEYEGTLVSTCQLSIVPSISHGGRPFGVIEYVVTHEDYRGNGFGRECIEGAIERARERDCYKVLLQTGRDDSRVHDFYEACGFDPDAKTGYSLLLDET